jgi:hypothetical protein
MRKKLRIIVSVSGYDIKTTKKVSCCTKIMNISTAIDYIFRRLVLPVILKMIIRIKERIAVADPK